jgi:hemolysin III
VSASPAPVAAVSEPLTRPLLRGVLHQLAFSVSLVVGTLLIVGVEGGRRHVAASVFAGSVAACFGASALYHRVTWTPRLRPWLRRVDHAGVYLLIAGTYTPVCLLVLDGAWRLAVLTTVYICAGLAIAFKFAWIDAPKWLAVTFGLALGWGSLIVLPQLVSRLNPAAVVLLGVGGLAYTFGAIVYARRRPDPAPAIFGYHELFHALTIVAAACQYVAIAFFVVHAG